MTYLFKSFPEELIWYQGMLYIIMLILNYFEFLIQFIWELIDFLSFDVVKLPE